MSAQLDQLTQDQWKKEAAEAAAAQVKSGMVVGLGTGSTAKYAIDALGRRVAEEGLKIVGIATSERSNAQALALGIPMTSFAEKSRIDLTIDGADEVLPGSLTLIKGHGGALLREKIVASASARMAVVAAARFITFLDAVRASLLTSELKFYECRELDGRWCCASTGNAIWQLPAPVRNKGQKRGVKPACWKFADSPSATTASRLWTTSALLRVQVKYLAIWARTARANRPR